VTYRTIEMLIPQVTGGCRPASVFWHG